MSCDINFNMRSWGQQEKTVPAFKWYICVTSWQEVNLLASFYVNFAEAGVFWEKRHQLSIFLRWDCRQVCRAFSKLVMDAGEFIPLWVVSPLGQWSWIPSENSLNKPTGANWQAALLNGHCINSCLQVLPLFGFLPWMPSTMNFNKEESVKWCLSSASLICFIYRNRSPH